MNKTDPNGGFFQRTAIKRLSSTTPSRERSTFGLDDFQLAPCKGEGRFGKVYPARHKITGFLLAIKQVKKESVRLMLEQFIQ
jgi:serine/threonine protein kinase